MRLGRTLVGSVIAGAAVTVGGMGAHACLGPLAGQLVSVALVPLAIIGALFWINR